MKNTPSIFHIYALNGEYDYDDDDDDDVTVFVLVFQFPFDANQLHEKRKKRKSFDQRMNIQIMNQFDFFVAYR